MNILGMYETDVRIGSVSQSPTTTKLLENNCL